MKSLVTPIVIPNITKFKVTSVVPYLDLSPPRSVVTVQFIGTGGSVVYSVVTLTAYDAIESTGITLNPLASAYSDRLSPTSLIIAGAHAAVQAANISAGSRNNQLQAVETALLTTGLVDASLNAT